MSVVQAHDCGGLTLDSRKNVRVGRTTTAAAAVVVLTVSLLIGLPRGYNAAASARFKAQAAQILAGAFSGTTSDCGPSTSLSGVKLCGESGSTGSVAVARLAARAEDRKARGDPEAARVLAIIDLGTADSSGKSIDRAISSLQTLRVEAVEPLRTSIDLSAAFLIRGDQSQSLLDYAESVEAAAGALDIDSTSSAARRNLTLGLKRMCIAGQPRTGVTPDLHTVLETQLVQWAEAVVERLPVADSILNAIRRRAERIEDQTLRDAVAAIAAASPTDRARIATAHIAYGAGRAAYNSSAYRDAALHFGRAHDTPVRSLAMWAELFGAASAVYLRDAANGERRMRAVIAGVDSVRFPSLAGRAYWMLGTTLLQSTDYEGALEAYELAGPLLQRAAEGENAAAIAYLLAETRFHLGDHRAAFTQSLTALCALAPHHSSRWLHNLILVSSRRLAARGLMYTAQSLQSHGVGVAARSGRLSTHAEALLGRAQLSAAAGDTIGVRTGIAEAVQLINRVPAGPIREQLLADSRVIQATVTPDAHGRTALDSAVSIAERSNNGVRVMRALTARAGAHAVAGNSSAALRDLARLTQMISQQRTALSHTAYRASLADAAASAFDRLALLHLASGDVEQALATIRTSRGAALRRSRGAVLATYAVLADTLVTWIETGTQVHLERQHVDTSALRATVERVIRRLEVGDARADDDLSALYELLFAPVAAHVSAGSSLALEVDRYLAHVPFAALRNRRSGRYVLDDYTVSLRLPVDATPVPPKPSGGREPVLVIGDPAFAAIEFPALERLRHGSAEARGVSALHAHSTTLAASQSTRAAVIEGMQNAAVMHFAGHALFDPRDPDQSLLVLAPTADDRGALTANDIRKLDLSRMKLAVLSACQTMSSSGGRAGFGGMTSAFLAAGATAVIGSVWRVDDEATLNLMTALHRHYAATQDAPGALRAAQLELRQSPDPALQAPSGWGGFVHATR